MIFAFTIYEFIPTGLKKYILLLVKANTRILETNVVLAMQ